MLSAPYIYIDIDALYRHMYINMTFTLPEMMNPK